MQVHSSMWGSLFDAGIIVQLTLLSLVAMSVFSWAIILAKKRQFKSVKQANEPFIESFWKATSLDAIYQQVQTNSQSPLSRVFKNGYLELQKLASSKAAQDASTAQPLLSGIDNLQRSLSKTVDHEIAALEDKLSFLATIGNTGPFIGLFGTVWGIMTAFRQIGLTQSARLDVVAPGISHALIATAIGLLTAIPAVVFYNHYVTKLKKEELALTSFSSDFLNIAKRNFFREK